MRRGIDGSVVSGKGQTTRLWTFPLGSPLTRGGLRGSCRSVPRGLVTALSFAVLSTESAVAETYDVTWYTVDGGGVMNVAGGTYAVAGTIGQPDAGTPSGGSYVVTGGFWGISPGCVAPAPALPEPMVPELGHGTRNRYLSFSGGTPGESEAVRVRFDLDGGGTGTAWVGEPREASESSGDSGPTPPPTFWAAELQCDPPFFTDWSVYPAIHVYGPSVAPGVTYEIALARESCETSEDGFTDTPLVITTSAWGDVVKDCSTCPCGPPDGDADFDDITAIVDKFKNLPCAPMKSRGDLAPATPDQIVDFVDIPWIVDAFRSLPYPFGGPTACP